MEIACNESVYIHEENKDLIYRPKPPNDSKYKKFIDLRKSSENIAKFDKNFKDSLSISSEEFDSGRNTWELFIEKLMRANPLLFYAENYKKYLVTVFKCFIEEGITHIEARALLGSVLNEVYFLIIYIKTLNLRMVCP